MDQGVIVKIFSVLAKCLEFCNNIWILLKSFENFEGSFMISKLIINKEYIFFFLIIFLLTIIAIQTFLTHINYRDNTSGSELVLDNSVPTKYPNQRWLLNYTINALKNRYASKIQDPELTRICTEMNNVERLLFYDEFKRLRIHLYNNENYRRHEMPVKDQRARAKEFSEVFMQVAINTLGILYTKNIIYLIC